MIQSRYGWTDDTVDALETARFFMLIDLLIEIRQQEQNEQKALMQALGLLR